MAELIWTEPALHDLDEITDYIARDKPDAAQAEDACRSGALAFVSLQLSMSCAGFDAFELTCALRRQAARSGIAGVVMTCAVC